MVMLVVHYAAAHKLMLEKLWVVRNNNRGDLHGADVFHYFVAMKQGVADTDIIRMVLRSMLEQILLYGRQ
jgi:hypothetical protein